MPERSNSEVGFTGQDREVLITLKVKMERLENDVRDGLSRIGRLESDRVGRKDLEDLLQVIEEKSDDNAALEKRAAEHEVRIADLEGIKKDVEWIKRYVWMAFGALAVLEFFFAKVWK